MCQMSYNIYIYIYIYMYLKSQEMMKPLFIACCASGVLAISALFTGCATQAANGNNGC